MKSVITCPQFSQKGTFERLVHAKDGSLLRVRFQVYEYAGTLRGRVIAVEPVISISGGFDSSLDSFFASNIKCLPASHAGSVYNAEYSEAFTSRISPYTELYFFNSQPTRAPAFK